MGCAKFIIWDDYDKLCAKVCTTLAYINEKSGLITKETIENISTDIIGGLIEKHSPEITESDIDSYIVQYFKNKLEASVTEMLELTNVKNALFLTSIMLVLGYDVQTIAEQLDQPIEEIEYAVTIISDNKIIE